MCEGCQWNVDAERVLQRGWRNVERAAEMAHERVGGASAHVIPVINTYGLGSSVMAAQRKP